MESRDAATSTWGNARVASPSVFQYCVNITAVIVSVTPPDRGGTSSPRAVKDPGHTGPSITAAQFWLVVTRGFTSSRVWGRAGRNSRVTWLSAFPNTHCRRGPARGSARWGRRTCLRWRCRTGRSCSSRGPCRSSRRVWPLSGLWDKVWCFWLVLGHSTKATLWLVLGLRVAYFQPFLPYPPTLTHQRSLCKQHLVFGNQQWEESSGFQTVFQRLHTDVWLLLGWGQAKVMGLQAPSLARAAAFSARKISVENVLLQMVDKMWMCTHRYMEIEKWYSKMGGVWTTGELGKELWVPVVLVSFLVSLKFFPDKFYLKCFL